MNIEHPNPYGAVDATQLEEFEKTIGARLPEDYRAFLLHSNGGKTERRAFTAPDDPLEEDSAWSEREIVGFYGLHTQIVAGSRDTMGALKLDEAWQDLQNDVPANTLLPISQDWSGNFICLQLGKNGLGEVMYFNHEYEIEVPLAKSFNAFVEMLSETAEDED